MIESTLMIAAVLVPALLILSIILVRVTPKTSYVAYYPGIAFFFIGLILLLFATIIDRVWIMGAGLGGIGIACLFSAGVSLMISPVVDVYRQTDYSESAE